MQSKKWPNLFGAQNKFGNTKTQINNLTFDSKGEATRYQELKLLEIAGEIKNLRLQVPFELHGANGDKVCTYIPDFTYIQNGIEIIEDFKGLRTATYNLKKKLFVAEYIKPSNGRKQFFESKKSGEIKIYGNCKKTSCLKKKRRVE